MVINTWRTHSIQPTPGGEPTVTAVLPANPTCAPFDAADHHPFHTWHLCDSRACVPFAARFFGTQTTSILFPLSTFVLSWHQTTTPATATAACHPATLPALLPQCCRHKLCRQQQQLHCCCVCRVCCVSVRLSRLNLNSPPPASLVLCLGCVACRLWDSVVPFAVGCFGDPRGFVAIVERLLTCPQPTNCPQQRRLPCARAGQQTLTCYHIYIFYARGVPEQIPQICPRVTYMGHSVSSCVRAGSSYIYELSMLWPCGGLCVRVHGGLCCVL